MELTTTDRSPVETWTSRPSYRHPRMNPPAR